MDQRPFSSSAESERFFGAGVAPCTPVPPLSAANRVERLGSSGGTDQSP